MRFALLLLLRQCILFILAALAYFGVRGLTEGEVSTAIRNADQVLDIERFSSVDLELGLQSALLSRQLLVDLANWIYIWGHWPVVAATLFWLVLSHRGDYFELRNAMFISGAIGLVIFALFPVAPPRLFAPEYFDTVTEHSESYRVLQPPGLTNKYAAVPSLHFGWNLLVALTWLRLGRPPLSKIAGVLMPLAMAFAVVGTANHWTFDVVTGGAVALTGLALERMRRCWLERNGRHPPTTAPRDGDALQPSPAESGPVLAGDPGPPPLVSARVPDGRMSHDVVPGR